MNYTPQRASCQGRYTKNSNILEVFIQERRIKRGDVPVLQHLLRRRHLHPNPANIVRATLLDIARSLSCSTDSISRVLPRLIKAGLIAVERVRDWHGRLSCYLYDLSGIVAYLEPKEAASPIKASKVKSFDRTRPQKQVHQKIEKNQDKERAVSVLQGAGMSRIDAAFFAAKASEWYITQAVEASKKAYNRIGWIKSAIMHGNYVFKQPLKVLTRVPVWRKELEGRDLKKLREDAIATVRKKLENLPVPKFHACGRGERHIEAIVTQTSESVNEVPIISQRSVHQLRR